MARWLGHPRIELEVCNSTNDEAAERAARGANHGTVVIARAQRKGRGRKARSWYSPPGENLYLSCVLRPTIDSALVPPITLAAGVAVARTVNSTGASASLKWPNDVVADGRKLAGILTEMNSRGQGVDHVILGIGVNLDSGEFPAELADSAVSLGQLGVSVERGEFLARLLDELEIWLDRFLAGGVSAIADPWLELAGLGGVSSPSHGRAPHRPRVRVGSVEGRVAGIDGGGFLLIEDEKGHTHRIIAGDVHPVTSAIMPSVTSRPGDGNDST
ncbi:MAG: biotin--[acetyl-CoA-carboxylase] ligase [Proteobacteria bacterium]|nr:biotin--[acetyl-CoA-carboxylase] ligase [Pseudomonadota bacterium]